MIMLPYSSLAELSAAVRYVSKHSEGKVFANPNKIIKFFKDMDIVSNINIIILIIIIIIIIIIIFYNNNNNNNYYYYYNYYVGWKW